jgi:MarR family transcriptional regulator, organic hydroperoxide resistance regulator
MPFGCVMTGTVTESLKNSTIGFVCVTNYAFYNMAETATRADPATEAWELFLQMFGSARGRMLDVQAEYGLKPPQYFALDALDEPVPMSHIADLLRCDRSAVTWITDRLEERGYVERRAAEHDRRVKLLALTDEGRRVRQEIRRRLAVPPEALARLSRGEQRELRDLLRKALDS